MAHDNQTALAPSQPLSAPPHPGVEVRALRAEDREGLARVLGHLCEQGSFTPDESRVALELIDVGLVPGQRDYRFLVAEVAGGPGQPPAVAGYACFGDAPMTDRVVDLYWIGVDPGLQGRSIGRALLSEVERAVHASGGRLLLAETAGKPSYASTRAFYLRTGYTEVARVPDYYRDGDDKVVYAKRFGS